MNSERREIIREMLQNKPFVALRELEARFPDISSMTLRRDIEYFEKIGEAIKVRGGARSMKFITTSMEDNFNFRMSENMQAKEKIAFKALELIEAGRSLFLDSGTTMLKLASLLPDERLTVTTTGPNIAMECIKKNQPIVNIVGGMLNRDNISVSGNQSLRFLSDINIDIAFIVPSGMSAYNGLTSGNYIECELKKLVVEKARKVVVLMDASKLDKTLPYTFCGIGDIDIIISDRELPADIIKLATESEIQMITA
ncbi:MAG: DeoR/GlpR family DNA-binding transcription regulator [Eubacteriales bacterium]|jgi:DeoR family fructose operon transcriptional repressor|nr:DeoR/GlpR family DNA-binding transcription regulator [Eubacteriales bacterium]